MRNARIPDRRKLVAIAQLAKCQENSEERAHRQESGQGNGELEKKVRYDGGQLVIFQRQYVAGKRDDIERHHEYGDSQKDQEKTRQRHARYHPGDDPHARPANWGSKRRRSSLMIFASSSNSGSSRSVRTV